MSGSKFRVCPACNQTYFGYPAISRVDNKTEICPNCGAKEAMVAVLNSEELQTRVKDFFGSDLKAK